MTALAVFFTAGAAISATAALSLLMPGGVLEPMWRLNPRGREAFHVMGALAPLLLLAVGGSCALAACGLWRCRRFGYWMAVVLLAVNGLGDVVNVLLGTEPRAAIGVPIVLAILYYLSRPVVRRAFDSR